MGKLATMTNDDDARAIGENFRRIRTEAGWSMVDLAKKMNDRGFNWTKVSVYKIETGERQLKVTEALAAFQIMGLDADTAFPGLIELNAQDRKAKDAIKAVLTTIEEMLDSKIGLTAALWTIDTLLHAANYLDAEDETRGMTPENLAMPSEEVQRRLQEIETAVTLGKVGQFVSKYLASYDPGLDHVTVSGGELRLIREDPNNINGVRLWQDQ